MIAGRGIICEESGRVAIGSSAVRNRAWDDRQKRHSGNQIVVADKGASSTQVVLLVDDNPQNLELLEVYMEDIPNIRVLTARNGLEALAQVTAETPDLILLDIMMPKMSGFEVCKRLKTDPKTRDIAIIMVTALTETGDVERAAECGADDYVSKPIDRGALIDLVKNHLMSRARS